MGLFLANESCKTGLLFTRMCLLGLTAFGAAGPATLFAADANAIPEIIVTAERREANLQSVPVAVSAFDATQLQDRQIVDSQDLQFVVPSLKMTNNITSPTNLSPSLRGSLQQDASLIVAESPFGIYVDDVYVARLNGNNLALNDIERVEVLRGPQGTLYGRNTLQGALKFLSRTPGEDPWFNASFGAGNFDQSMASASVGAPLGGDFAGSLSGMYNSKDGEYYNVVTRQDTGDEQNWAVRGKLRYMGIDKADIVLSASYVDSTNDSLPLVPATTPGVSGREQFTSDDLVPIFGDYSIATPTLVDPQPPPITANPSGSTEQTIISLNASYDLTEDMKLRSITGYVHTRDFFSTDFSGLGVVIGASDVNVEQWSQELEVLGTAFNDRLSYLGGLYYFHEDGDQDFGWYFTLPVSTSQIQADTDSYAVFAQATYRITDALNFTAGVRWTRDEKNFSIDQQVTEDVLDSPLAFLTNPDLNQVGLDDTYNETTPKFVLDYTFQPFSVVNGLMGYVSAANGFKSGGYNGIAIFNLGDATQSYGPETNWTYEAGIKSEAFDNRVRFNAAYFWADITDLTANSTNGFSFPVQNVGDAEVHGFELELTALLMENLTFYATAAFAHGSYSNLTPCTGVNVPGENCSAPALAPYKWGVHPRVPQVPAWAYTLGFDYGVPVPLPSGSGMFRLGLDWFNTDDYVTSATNDFVASSWDRVNGYVGVDVNENWNVRLAVKNLGDSEDITSGSRSVQDSVGGPSGLGGFIALPPREIMLSLNYTM
jgi:iron complex outermembrane receptor protein